MKRYIWALEPGKVIETELKPPSGRNHFMRLINQDQGLGAVLMVNDCGTYRMADETGRILRFGTLPRNHPIKKICSVDVTAIAATTVDGSLAISTKNDIYVRMTKDGGWRRWMQPDAYIRSISLSPNGRYLALLFDDFTQKRGRGADRDPTREGRLAIIDLRAPDTGQPAKPRSQQPPVRLIPPSMQVATVESAAGVFGSIAFSADGQYLVAVGSEPTVHIRIVPSLKIADTIEFPEGVYAAALDRTGSRLICGGRKWAARIPVGREFLRNLVPMARKRLSMQR
jgi:hypothetical protein